MVGKQIIVKVYLIQETVFNGSLGLGNLQHGDWKKWIDSKHL